MLFMAGHHELILWMWWMQTQDFTLRAPGPDHSHTKYFVGKFSGVSPGFVHAHTTQAPLTLPDPSIPSC